MPTDSLLPPNSTKLERALEAATARASEISVPIQNLLDPDNCPLSLLPWLAWALSVDSWSPDWTEGVKRSVVRNAIAIQRRKGTARSVRDTVAAFGGGVAIREWWQLNPPGAPFTFDLVLTLGTAGAPATARFVEDVVAEVERTKPVRAHFTFTQGLQAEAAIKVAGGARVAAYRRLQMSLEDAA